MHDDEIDQIDDPKKLGFLLENEVNQYIFHLTHVSLGPY